MPESLPVLMGRAEAIEGAAQSAKTLSPTSFSRQGSTGAAQSSKMLSLTPFSRQGSTGSDEDAILREILNEALVLPPDNTLEEKTPDAPTESSSCPRSPEEAVDVDVDMYADVPGRREGPGKQEREKGGHKRTGSSHQKRSNRVPELDTAATKVQKSYRGHRARLQVPQLTEQTGQRPKNGQKKKIVWMNQPISERLETVEEEARVAVSFDTVTMDGKECRTFDRKKTPYIKKEDLEARVAVSFDTVTMDGKECRTFDRKKTPYIKKEDLSFEEPGVAVSFDTVTMDGKECRTFDRKKTPYIKKEDFFFEEDSPSERVVEIVMSEILRDQPRRNLRAERKLTGFVKKEDLREESDSEDEASVVRTEELPDKHDSEDEAAIVNRPDTGSIKEIVPSLSGSFVAALSA
jgi:hypothetical protein